MSNPNKQMFPKYSGGHFPRYQHIIHPVNGYVIPIYQAPFQDRKGFEDKKKHKAKGGDSGLLGRSKRSEALPNRHRRPSARSLLSFPGTP